ncbi:hypothetical protein GQX74_010058 [Glossina fuscipes]|nr:hypothetical protein GQX74_010058 [Glossina fuscipes]
MEWRSRRNPYTYKHYKYDHSMYLMFLSSNVLRQFIMALLQRIMDGKNKINSPMLSTLTLNDIDLSSINSGGDFEPMPCRPANTGYVVVGLEPDDFETIPVLGLRSSQSVPLTLRERKHQDNGSPARDCLIKSADANLGSISVHVSKEGYVIDDVVNCLVRGIQSIMYPDLDLIENTELENSPHERIRFFTCILNACIKFLNNF